MSVQISQLHLLTQAIEFAQQNHRVISQNLANVNTPNYQTRQLSFEQFLHNVERAKPALNKPVRYEVGMTEGLAERADGNNVDLDSELANIKRNDLIFQTLTQLMGSKMDMLKLAIRG